YAGIAAFLIAGLATTQTLGAIAATIAGGIVMTFLISRRRAALVLAVLLPGALGIIVAYAPLRARVVGMLTVARGGNIDAIFPGRATAFLSALEMVKDRPL